MVRLGEDVLTVGRTKIGQSYVLGADVPLDNPNWKGPWDCAEFASWAVYQAYDMVFGAGRPKKVALAEPYSGYWYDEARKYGITISWQDALDIPGAILIRAPGKGKIGHVALSMGDGEKVLEAKNKASGVGIFKAKPGRTWSIGCLLEGVEYGDSAPTSPGPVRAVVTPPSDGNLLFLKRPLIKGPAVLVLQAALAAAGIDPGPLDGEFGPMTEAAVVSFQIREGLEVDGVVGPQTANALGLAFPIAASAQDTQEFNAANAPADLGPLAEPAPAGGAVDRVVEIERKGRVYRARTAGGVEFPIGSETAYTDDMHRRGLFHGGAVLKEAVKVFGAYKADDHVGEFGQWARMIEPTLTAEASACFGVLNTYDRAAFTFGAPQFAAHADDFKEYLRTLLALDTAKEHMPDLDLASTTRKTIRRRRNDGRFDDLDELVDFKRPNGKVERQPRRLMDYLNSDPVKVDEAELWAAARLLNWVRLEPRARTLQIALFIANARRNLAQTMKGADAATTKAVRRNWPLALWIVDIRHQGRGTNGRIRAALAGSAPEAALKQIGAGSYAGRIRTVGKKVDALRASGALDGFDALA